MDHFFKARAADRRFPGGRVDVQRTAISKWYHAPKQARYVTTVYKASMATEGSYKAAEPKKKKKKERRDHDSGGNASTSDGSDSSPCWSDYAHARHRGGHQGLVPPQGQQRRRRRAASKWLCVRFFSRFELY